MADPYGFPELAERVQLIAPDGKNLLDGVQICTPEAAALLERVILVNPSGDVISSL